ncbi:MAG: glycosyltransferase [Cyclobacteriaceae bacterium]|nr:glycosyltransferase [Cyclobacteriaceae bacterium]
MQIVVLGMHRSGTSVVSRILNLMGIYFGAEGSSTSANDENPKGFWERQDVRNLNDYILQSNGLDWYKISEYSLEKFSSESIHEFESKAKKLILSLDAHRPWFIKEPRLCLTLPFWLKLLEVPVCVFVYRNPQEIAASLEKRNGFPLHFGIDLWERYTYSLLRASENLPLIFVNYNNLLQNPKEEIDALFQKLSSAGISPLRKISDKELNAFIDSNLYRNRSTGLSLLRPNQLMLYNQVLAQEINNTFLDSYTTTKLSDTSLKRMEELFDFRIRLQGMFKDADDVLNRIATERENREKLSKENSERASEIARLKQSLSISQQAHKNKVLEEEILKLKFENERREYENERKEYDLKIKNLNQRINLLTKNINDKEALISKYWFQIQDMRLSSRLLRLFGIRKRTGSLIESVKKSFDERSDRKTLNQKKTKIVQSIVSSSDHSLPSEKPMVSIIIINRDGLAHLKILFNKWKETTIYPNYEIIVFDNDSKDDSVRYLNKLNLNLRVIRNNTNDSFSSANNKTASEAKGELLLFLNNDTEPIYGWLNQMVKMYLTNKEKIGSIGARLIYPIQEGEEKSLRIQHNGIGFKMDNDFFRPYNLDNNEEYCDLPKKDDFHRICTTAACLLVPKNRFNEVGGFDEQYVYGFEDVDLGLKLHQGGYDNLICYNSVLFHYEFGTQGNEAIDVVASRRNKNRDILKEKWHKYLQTQIFKEKLISNGTLLFTRTKMTVAFVVTEAKDDTTAGDYFTAQELGIQFRQKEWNVVFLERKNGDWYDIPLEVDILIVMLHNYDISKIKTKRNIVKIVWMRNWFNAFAEDYSLHRYDITLVSSAIAQNYLRERIGIASYVFPIAGNHDRFKNENNKYDPNFECDFCFTGSYWNDPREIIDLLHPELLPEYKFHLYGLGWESVRKFKIYQKGFVPYAEMPVVYQNTKILIDDANRVTKSWGSVNSRVYDAILSGVLVLTNNEKGSAEIFNKKLPVFKTTEELNQLIRFYLTNTEERIQLVTELQEIVKQHHTYSTRANELISLLNSWGTSEKIALKVPAPAWDVCKEWGDFHLALGLKKQFEKLKFLVSIQMLREWDDDIAADYVLVFRGLSRYYPKKWHFNMMWNISHPDEIQLEEYQQFDHVFVASNKLTKKLKPILGAKVSPLHQCTDPEIFRPTDDPIKTEVLFVGNSRKVLRDVVKNVISFSQFQFKVYGSYWDGLIDPKYIGGEHIENRDLYKYYSGAKALLNDHWEDMKEEGFVSNRLFDAVACNANIVSDYMKEIEEIFGNRVHTYKDRDQLLERLSVCTNGAIRHYNDGHEFVSKYHSFETRANQILSIINDRKKSHGENGKTLN